MLLLEKKIGQIKLTFDLNKSGPFLNIKLESSPLYDESLFLSLDFCKRLV